MVYIDNQGRVLQSKPFGLGSIADLFWGVVAFFSLFFRSLVNPDANSKGDKYTSDYRAPGRGPPPSGPRRRFGGFGGGAGGAGPPPMAGGGG